MKSLRFVLRLCCILLLLFNPSVACRPGGMSWIDNRRCKRGTEDDRAPEFSPPSPDEDEGGGQ